MSLATPVAFFVFNRPDLTKQVFAKIAAIRPRKLLLVADGPRSADEAAACEATRAVVSEVDWDCEVLTNFADTNMGCRHRVSSGLDWVFSQAEEAIILEDDCLPADSFFRYCEELLQHYRDDERIMHISGDNFQGEHSRTDASYYFSRYFHIWGWASWRRAWRFYDVAMRSWPANRELIRTAYASEEEANFWVKKFDRLYAGKIDTWDHQWAYACLSQHGLAVAPNVNLVSNIGFGPRATHGRKQKDHARLPTFEITDLQHPQSIIRNAVADEYTFQRIYNRQPVRPTKAEASPVASRPKKKRFADKLLRRWRREPKE